MRRRLASPVTRTRGVRRYTPADTGEEAGSRRLLQNARPTDV